MAVEPGEYTVAVMPKDGYTIEVDCGNGATPGNTATLTLQDGNGVRCTFVETTKSGYTTEVLCDNGATGSNSVTINLNVNQTVICVFTNQAQPGTIKIVTTVVGAVPPTSWRYTGTAGSFTVAAAGSSKKLTLDAASYTFAQTIKPGYAVTASFDAAFGVRLNGNRLTD